MNWMRANPQMLLIVVMMSGSFIILAHFSLFRNKVIQRFMHASRGNIQKQVVIEESPYIKRNKIMNRESLARILRLNFEQKNETKPTSRKCHVAYAKLKGYISLHLMTEETNQTTSSGLTWPPTLKYLDFIYKDLEHGGVYKGPKECKCATNFAIIVPFRDREQHLRFFLFYIHPLLQRQRTCYTIIVVEQDDDKTFNKGKMMNSGFLYANSIGDFDCYIFHDVDMIAENDRNIYQCKEKKVAHLVWQMDKYDYEIPYYDYIGGVLAFTKEQFITVNGFSTMYEGWGGEDDDMMKRIWAKGYELWRPRKKNIARFKMIHHNHDKRNPRIDDYLMQDLLFSAISRQDSDGLNSLHTVRTDVIKYPSHTRVKVRS
uniref:Beta-1,4-galactosyltransferase n=1 Tax=Ciona intestinalis TaxID=7719 RepID=F6WUK5_CIOIN|nr:beta-1,4-galactosyltransferase 1 [Ciona intestinalis]|eukprot:XP_002125920.1 beta-1,4-galactosyltransferase 1 [Ciona intestinalis]